MAGYHYKLQIVPALFSSIVGEDNCIEDYWVKEQPNASMLSAWRSLLPKNSSWGETEEYRSETNYSVLYIWWEQNKVWSIQLELAPVSNGEDLLLESILLLCQKYNYKIYSERSGKLISPNRVDLWQDFTSVQPFPIYQRQGMVKFN